MLPVAGQDRTAGRRLHDIDRLHGANCSPERRRVSLIDDRVARLAVAGRWPEYGGMTAKAFTLRSVAGLPMEPRPLKTAIVVVIDAQVEYTTGRLPLEGVDEALANIARVLDAARRVGAPIVHVVHRGPAGGLFDPAVGGAIVSEATPLEGESIVEKTLPNSFAGTTFDEELEARGASELVIVGFMTHMCVSATTRSALDHGYTTTVLSDATATRSLPSVDGGDDIEAATIHAAGLAALADRFALVTSTDALLRA